MRAKFLVLSCLLFACGGNGNFRAARLAVGVSALEIDEGGRRLRFLRADTTIVELGLDAFSVATVPALDASRNYNPYEAEPEEGAAPNWGKATWKAATSFALIASDETSATVTIAFGDDVRTELRVHADADDRFSFDWVPTRAEQAIAYMRVKLTASESEAFYGLGEWPEPNHRGRRRPMQIEASSLENGSDENHVPIPLLLSTARWGLFMETRRPGSFDVARKDPRIVEATFGTAEDSAQGLRFHLFSAEQPIDLTHHYYKLTGFPRLPADWAIGPWFWRDENINQAEVVADIEKIRDLDLAFSGMWIDLPYASHVGIPDFESTTYPDPRAMILRAQAMGLRFALWSVPYLEEGAEPLLTEAKTRGFFPPTHGLYVNPWGIPIDFTNPEAFAWWQSKIRQYTDLGIEGWKLDYAEDVATGLSGGRLPWRFFDGSNELTMHYGYTKLFHQAYAETQPPSGGYLLCRAGRWGDQTQASVIWPGDLDAALNRRGDPIDGKLGVGGLSVAVGYALSLGPSGFPLFASDTGGYLNSPPNRETFIRWMEHTAFSAVMNVGDSSSEPPWEFTEENGRDTQTLDLFRVYARLHMRLFPYLWTYAQRVLSDGRAILRPLGLAHPELGEHPSDVYLLGDDLLVAPVVAPGQPSRDVTLPAGQWLDWWDGTLYQGGARVTLPAPLERIPVLLRAGGVVPLLRDTIDSLAPTTEPARVDSYATTPGVLTLRSNLLGATQFTAFDGTQVTSSASTFSIIPGSVFTYGYKLELLHADRPARVLLDGVVLDELASWSWTPDAHGTLTVQIGAGPHLITIEGDTLRSPSP